MSTLTLNLTGRIDANNAPKGEADIADALAKNPGAVPEFDASELQYISSAGLRVLLKFRKKFGKKLDVLNVSGDVYDIFSVTGFTELLNVRKRLREISIEGCPVIGGGGSGLGNPIADLLVSYAHFVFMSRFSASHGKKNHERAIGLDCNTLGAMWNIMLPEYFGTTDTETLKGYETMISGYSPIMVLYAFAISPAIPYEVRIMLAAPIMELFRQVIPVLKPIDNI